MHAVDDLVLLIDDDIKLDPDCIKHMAEAWQKMDDGRLLGVGGIIKNNRHAGSAEKIFNKIFLLGSDLSWDVSDSGYQVWDDSIDRLERGHYIHGGFCMYRPDIARKILFPVFQDGRNSLEDVHFALSAKILGYRFAIEPKATAFHAHSKTQRDGSYEAGLKESMNRRLIFRDLCEQGRWRNLKFAWSSFGWVLRQFLSGHFIKGSGMMVGMFTRLPE
jgi:GT2 family glycosyltransferase